MSDSIYKEIRNLKTTELRERLINLGVDYLKEGASTKEDLRKLLIKNMTNPQLKGRKRNVKEVLGKSIEPDKRIKRNTIESNSSQRSNGAPKQPPGFLKSLKPQKTIKIEKSKDEPPQNNQKSSSDSILENEQIEVPFNVDNVQTQNNESKQPNIRPRKQWGKRLTTEEDPQPKKFTEMNEQEQEQYMANLRKTSKNRIKEKSVSADRPSDNISQNSRASRAIRKTVEDTRNGKNQNSGFNLGNQRNTAIREEPEDNSPRVSEEDINTNLKNSHPFKDGRPDIVDLRDLK